MSLPKFFAALAYFTRIPNPFALHEMPTPGLSSYAPFAGWIVGLVSGVVLVLAIQFFPAPVGVVACMIAGVWLTRGMHEDGWSDFCDGFGGGWDREQTLEIMRDPRAGVFGVTGLALVLLLKYSILVALTTAVLISQGTWVLVLLLVAIHALSRFAAVSFMRTHDYASSDKPTRARAMTSRFSGAELAVAAAGGLLPLAVLAVVTTPAVLAVIAMVYLCREVMGRMIVRRLGGYTGDCLGAVQQITEVVSCLALYVALS